MKNEDKLKLAKKHKENERTKEAIVDEAKALTAYTKQRKQELAEIKESIEALGEALEVNVAFPDIAPLMNRLEKLEELPSSFQDIKELAHTIKISIDKLDPISQSGFRELWEMVVRQNNKIDKASKDQADRTIEKFTDLQQYLDQLTLTLQQGQSPEDFKPVRLVVGGDGIPLKFLQDMPSSRGGGGIDSSALSTSANQTNGSQKTQIVDTGGEAATVTDGKLDVNASVSVAGQAAYADSGGTDRKGLVDADRHVQADVLSSALPSGAATSANQYVMRPSEKTGRTYKAAAMDAATGNNTIYTVTATKKLYITSWGINARNVSTIAMGHLRLRDGGIGGTIIGSWTIGVAVAGTIAPNIFPTNSFEEPKQFSTDLFMEFVGGTVTASFQFTGYEE